jgi:integrase
LLAFLTADHPLRDKTLWWLLYETAARAGEVLALNVEDLDLARRRAVVIGKGGRAELIGWETKTARLLPRLLRQRRNGPTFLADIAPATGRQPALADVDPDTGRARLSYRRAAEVIQGGHRRLDIAPTAPLAADALGRGRNPTPAADGQSRHTSLSSLAIYAKPTFDAVAAATAALDPDRRR